MNYIFGVGYGGQMVSFRLFTMTSKIMLDSKWQIALWRCYFSSWKGPVILTWIVIIYTWQKLTAIVNFPESMYEYHETWSQVLRIWGLFHFSLFLFMSQPGNWVKDNLNEGCYSSNFVIWCGLNNLALYNMISKWIETQHSENFRDSKIGLKKLWTHSWSAVGWSYDLEELNKPQVLEMLSKN